MTENPLPLLPTSNRMSIIRSVSDNALVSANKLAGMSLIELLVSVSLAVFLLLTISAMFMTFLLSNAQTNLQKSLTQEGNVALSQMEFLLRNALHLTENSGGEVCQSNMDEIALVSIDGHQTNLGGSNFNLGGDGFGASNTIRRLASSSAHPDDGAVTRYLTSKQINVKDGGPRFDCQQTSDTTWVKVEFTLERNLPASPEETFGTTLYLRN